MRVVINIVIRFPTLIIGEDQVSGSENESRQAKGREYTKVVEGLKYDVGENYSSDGS